MAAPAPVRSHVSRDRRGASRPVPAGDVVVAYLRQQAEAMVHGDPAVRRDEPDAVHAMRVATRRLRSTLATFRTLFDAERVRAMREELSWLGGTLGGPRDAEVMLDRLRRLLSAQPADLIMGPVGEQVDDELRQLHRRAHDQLVAALDGERYRRLLEALADLVGRPPLSAAASRPADRTLHRLVGRSYRRVVTASMAADAAGSAAEVDVQLHEVRKAAKRARYAGECAVPALGRQAVGLARWMRVVQEVLGEHQDSVAARAVLGEMGGTAYRVGGSGFTVGLLYGLEQGRGEAAQEAYRAVIGKALRRGWHAGDR